MAAATTHDLQLLSARVLRATSLHRQKPYTPSSHPGCKVHASPFNQQLVGAHSTCCSRSPLLRVCDAPGHSHSIHRLSNHSLNCSSKLSSQKPHTPTALDTPHSTHLNAFLSLLCLHHGRQIAVTHLTSMPLLSHITNNCTPALQRLHPIAHLLTCPQLLLLFIKLFLRRYCFFRVL
jgi:hypothetical protein